MRRLQLAIAVVLCATACASPTTLRVELTSAVEISDWTLDVTRDDVAIVAGYTLPLGAMRPRIGALGSVVVRLDDIDALLRVTVRGTAASGETLVAVSDVNVRARRQTTVTLALTFDTPDLGSDPDLGSAEDLATDDLADGKVQVTLVPTVIGAATAGMVTSTPFGIGCGTTCTFRVDPGTLITLTSTNPPRTQVAFGAPCGGGLRECQFVADADTIVPVTFSPANYAFVTSTQYDSGLGGLAGADTKCQTQAMAANLPGTYKAWISSTTENASARIISTGARGWIRTDGRPFADTVADITSQRIYYTLKVDELGNDLGTASTPHVATATNGAGVFSGPNASDWTVAGQSTSGGYYYKGFDFWVSGHMGTSSRLYCLGTDLSSPLIAPTVPALGRRVFLSAAQVNGTIGVTPADNICVAEASAAGFPRASSYRAALATTIEAASARFNLNGPTWYRVDGARLAPTATSFFSSQRLETALSLKPTGPPLSQRAWFGSATANAPASGLTDSCNDWTVSGSGPTARMFDSTDTVLTSSTITSCNASRSVICVEN